MEVVIAVVFDFNFAFLGGMLKRDMSGEVLAETVCDRADVNIHFAGDSGFFRIAGRIRGITEE